ATDAAVILVGLTRGNRVSRILTTEVPVQVAQLSPVPVLAVPRGRDWPPRRGAVAVDFSPESLEALGVASRLLARGGELQVVHVLPPVWRDPSVPELRARIDEVTGRLDGLVRGVEETGVAAIPRLLHGEPATALVD